MRNLFLALCFCIAPLQGGDFFIDWLFWTVREEGISYARSGVSTGPTTSVPSPGKLFDPDWEWDSGVRVGGTVDLECTCWKAFLQYTHIDTPAHGSTISGAGSVLKRVWDSPNFFEDDLTDASAKWQLGFHTVDAGLTRPYDLCYGLVISPTFGFKGSWQRQSYDILYHSNLNNFPATNSIEHNLEFYGAGLRAGMDGYWACIPCIDIVGSISISSLWGQFLVKRSDTLVSTDEPDNEPETTTAITFLSSRRHYQLVPVLELYLGGRWKTTICKNIPVYLQVGWEHQIWWDMSRFLKTSLDEITSDGNLALQGLTFRGGFCF